MRHMRNFRMKPRCLPQMRHRLTRRVLYFGRALLFSIAALRAILRLSRYLRKGMPMRVRRLRASASVRAVVAIAMFMPLIRSILS
jgi:hypothetical protein